MVYALCDRAFQKNHNYSISNFYVLAKKFFPFLKEGEDWNKTVTNFINKLV